MTIFFTADTHFGHKNIIQHCNRPFQTALEMNEALISNWNTRVQPHDSVYHLGDFAVLRPERVKELAERLNGKIYLIRGNHERSTEHELCRDRFEWIKDYFNLKLSKTSSIVLFHYALRVWEKRHWGAWHLYGHSHGKLPPIEGAFTMDVGVDCWNYSPVSLDAIRAEMTNRGWKERSRKNTAVEE
jgi:calcineurin-like phosphoesterase family protein